MMADLDHKSANLCSARLGCAIMRHLRHPGIVTDQMPIETEFLNTQANPVQAIPYK
jgi:hypothetical protein